MPILRGCCCFDLKTGSKIIGIITLVLEIIGFLTAALCLLFFWITEETVKNVLEDLSAKSAAATSQGTHDPSSRTLNPRYDDQYEREQVDNEEMEKWLNLFIRNMHYVYYILIGVLALQLLDIICSSCLIHGIRKNRRGFLIPFIVLHFIFLVVELGLLVLTITLYAYLAFAPLHVYFVSVIIADLIWLGVHIYFTLVVVSEHQALGLILMHSNDEMCLK